MPLAIGEPTAVRRHRVARVEPDRLGQIGDGAVEIAALVIGHAAIVIGRAEVRIELDRLAEILEGVLIVVDAQIAEAARVIGFARFAGSSLIARAKSASAAL